ncbi:FG-GAP-like repeat-containing protein [Pelagicoccus sp. SDUM812003]|uniref:FG-GAP-like repeat-containing protein n=1 Tax=Pelagicoccus sp. SDUM812003 TaxID=3041267 RepID=UPI00280F123C|nr:FG-GAP-like repeat-containing protein [Pelagicoccus sp. SDUM812003]MDQ8204713.1 FG-GAP-like repeat-containing protein [Pelagicoccus sp. SDUM812003]
MLFDVPLRFVPAILCFGASMLQAAENDGAISKQPFLDASQGDGKRLFSELSSDRTGIVAQNLYDDPSMWGNRYREYMGGSMGSGVAAGDYDGDGWVDLYVTLKTKPGRLYRNLGDWRFEDVTEEAGLSEKGSILDWVSRAFSSDESVIWRHGSVFADVDNDGLLDLFVCRNDAPNLLYMNQGDGTFEEEAEDRGLALADGSVIGAFADYDRDGWLDVLILTNQVDGSEPSGRADRLYRNLGDGYYEEVTLQAGISAVSFGHSAFWFDFDLDGWQDFYIANDYAGPDYLYRNRGDGSFENVLSQMLPHISYSSMGSDRADINNDGKVDFLVADMAATSRITERRRQPAASTESALAMAAQSGMVSQYARNTLFLNAGNGVFMEVACLAGLEATDWTWSLRFEDFDNDGWQDLHVTNGMLREANNSDILTQMMRARSESQRVAVMKRAPKLEESNLAYRNLGGVKFTDVSESWGLDQVGVSFGAATADFDKDGDLDLVYLNHDGGVTVHRNDNVGNRRIQVRLKGTRSNRFGVDAVIVAETEMGQQLRSLTPARGYASGSELVAHFGLGDSQLVRKLTVRWPSGAEQVFENLESDYSYLITEEPSGSEIVVEAEKPLFEDRTEAYGLQMEDKSRPALPESEQALLPFRTDRRGPGIAVADVNGDRMQELFLTATTGSPAKLLIAEKGRYRTTLPLGSEPPSVEHGPSLFFDAEGDGQLDLLVTRSSANRSRWPQGFIPVLYSVNEDGKLVATERFPAVEINAGAACLADVDADGDLDLFIGARSIPGSYPETPRSYLFRNDAGRFVDITQSSTGLSECGLVKDALFRDLDGDGQPDLLLALEWDFIRCYRNVGAGVYEDVTASWGFESGGRGWWNSLASGDFNGDGRLDVVAGNLGLNTSYQASREHPARLYYGVFGRRSTKVMIEAHYEDGKWYPLRSRGDLGSTLSEIYRSYPRNNDYSVASMEDVFGVEQMEQADLLEADSFQSGVFLSKSDGSFAFQAFPHLAQAGPMQGLVVSDLNGDGSIDLCAVQNSDVSYPAFEGALGVFLIGDGQGGFQVLPPDRSGLAISGPAMALTLLDPAGQSRPGLFMTQQGGSTRFLQSASDSALWTKIELRGPSANPDGIGARIELSYTDGSVSTHEVSSGGGWLAQGEAALWVAVTDTRALVEARVRWPSGEVTTHSIPSDKGGVWRLSQ